MAVDQNNGQVDQMVPENYENLLDDYSHFAPPAADEVLQGTVLSVTAKDVIVDFGYKSEGLVPIEQFQTPDGEITVQAGDVVDVMIDHGEQPEGYVLLSHTRAARLRIWDNLEKAYQEQLVISGRVLGRVKGGLAVDVGIKAFMPGSQVDPRPVHNLDSLVGQDIPVKIIKLNRRRGNVVVSRKTGGRRGDQRPQERHARAPGGRRGGHRRRQEPDRVRRVRRSGRHRRPAARHRHVVRPRDASVRSAARGRRDHRQGAEVRPRQGARLAGHQAARAGSLGDRGRALSGQQPRDRPRGERHRLRRLRGTGSRASKA